MLKQLLTTAPILAFLDFSLPFVLYTNVSDVAVGAVVSQIHVQKQGECLAYSSQQLNKAERGYSTIKKEASYQGTLSVLVWVHI